MEYCWDISDGDTEFKQVVHDYSISGLGYFYTYVDPEADFGRGEVKFTHINPFRVYVDPAARNRYFTDASSIILSTIITKDQAVSLYPKLEDVIDDIDTMTNEEDYPTSSMKNHSQSFTPDVVKDKD